MRKRGGIKEWETESKRERDREREIHERAQPFSCSSSSSTGQGSWKRRDYQGAGTVLAWAASAHFCTARYTALLKHCTWFSHTHTQVMLADMVIISHGHIQYILPHTEFIIGILFFTVTVYTVPYMLKQRIQVSNLTSVSFYVSVFSQSTNRLCKKDQILFILFIHWWT